MKKSLPRKRLRLISQILFFGLAMAILLFVIIIGTQAIHNACPYAVICFGMNWAQLLGFAIPLFSVAIVIGVIIAVSTFFWGRMFCGWICPLGSLQEAIFALRSNKYRIRQTIPYYMERKLGIVKYFILAITSVLSLLGLAWVYIQACPFYALSQIPNIAWSGIVLLATITISAFLIDRFWCRFLCPYAAILNIFQKLGSFFGFMRSKILRNIERCNDCGLCMLYCPMNINLSQSILVDDLDCIHCEICALKCPKNGLSTCKKEL